MPDASSIGGRLSAMHDLWCQHNSIEIDRRFSYHLWLTLCGRGLPEDLKPTARRHFDEGRVWEHAAAYKDALAKMEGYE